MSLLKSLKPSLALAAFALLVPAAPATSFAEDIGARAVIVTHGTGTVQIMPDSVRVDIGVDAQAPTIERARQNVSGTMKQVVDALKGLGIQGLEITTRQISFNPVYSTPRDGTAPVIVGYSATNHVLVLTERVAVAELSQRAARIVDTAISAGANNVGAISFYAVDPTQAEDRSLALAAENARHDAETIARASGMTVVTLAYMEESTGSRVPRALEMRAESLASTPIEVGDITIQSDVTARYSIH